MRVLVAGATGAIGRQLVPALRARGYDVVALTRSPRSTAGVQADGADAVVADALDRNAVMEAVARARPDVVIHQLTAMRGVRNLRRFDQEMSLTNRLRTEATDHLLAAARATGARRFIAQSYGGWTFAREGAARKAESDAFDPSPPRRQQRTLAAIRHLENAVTGADDIDGVVLRYGSFYGPGTAFARDGDIVSLVRQRKLPLVGNGAGIWSFVHIADAAAATVAAVERGARGIFNVADDTPAPVADWLPELAHILGARPPQRIPAWLARLAIGEVGVSLMTRVRGMANDRARRELGWQPRFACWRDGFRAELAAP